MLLTGSQIVAECLMGTSARRQPRLQTIWQLTKKWNFGQLMGYPSAFPD